jgi:hypothetical protein
MHRIPDAASPGLSPKLGGACFICTEVSNSSESPEGEAQR